MSAELDEGARDYLRNAFLPRAEAGLPALPLEDETHVADWERWLSAGPPTPARLGLRLPQLRLGVGEDVAQSEGYRRAILRGQLDPAAGEDFEPAGRIEVRLAPHWAGQLPVLLTEARADFEFLFRTLGNKGLPVSISPQVNAQMLAGLISPTRLAAAREAWGRGAYEGDPRLTGCRAWGDALRALDRSDPTFFRERLLILHQAPYADIPAEEAPGDWTPEAWLEGSRVIRTEHEFTHYATKRLYGAMRLNLHDELIADCMGLRAGLGRFDASFFLAGLGISPGASPPEKARAWTYLKGLSSDESLMICSLAAAAARRLESWLEQRPELTDAVLLRTLANCSLEELASEDAALQLDAALSSRP